MSEFAFTIALKDLITGPAKNMQRSLIDTQKGLLASSKTALSLEGSIKSLENAMVKSAATGNVSAYQRQARELAALKVALDQTDTSQLKLARNMGNEAREIGETSEKLASMAEILTAAAEVGLELGRKIGEAALELGQFTLEAVQTKQAAIAMFRAMAGGKDAGDKLFEMIEGLATELPQSKDQLTAWAKEFAAMGILDQGALRAQLKATASAAALMGDSGAEAFTTLSKKIQESIATTGRLKLADKQLAGLAATGVNVSDVAAQMGMSAKALEQKLTKGAVSAKDFGDALNKALTAKGAGPLDRMSGSLATLQGKFKEAIGDIFEDVDVSPFTDAMKDLLGTFTQSTSSGKVMKSVFGSLFSSMFTLAGKAIVLVRQLFLGAIILGLKAYIAIKPWLPLLKVLGMIVGVAALAFAATFVPAVLAGVVALGSLIATALVAAAPFLLIGALVVGVYEAFTHWEQIKSILRNIGNAIAGWVVGVLVEVAKLEQRFFQWATDVAANIVSGLVSGIVNGTGLVIQAIAGLAHGAMNKLKSVLGIASPSKEFAKLGKQTGAGFSMGLDVSRPMIAGASMNLADVANDNATAGASKTIPKFARAVQESAATAPSGKSVSSSGGAAQRSGPSSAAGITVNVEAGAIVINGAQGNATELTEQAVSLLFEKIALSQGVAPDTKTEAA